MSGEIEWHPKETILDPKGPYVQVFRDHWWAVDGQGQVALFADRGRIYPQCNLHRSIAEKLSKSAGGVGIEQIPLAFIPISPSDY